MKSEESAGKSGAQSSVVLVSIASTVGTAIEWYDFVLYALMAGVVLNKLFFPAANPTVSTILAYATFSVGFLARPSRRHRVRTSRRPDRPQAAPRRQPDLDGAPRPS